MKIAYGERKRDYVSHGENCINASVLGNLTEIAYCEEGENICRKGEYCV